MHSIAKQGWIILVCSYTTGTTSRLSSGFLRLTNGPTLAEGRVEIWYFSQWNTVCDDSWSGNDARVVCRQLGYQGAVSAHLRAHFGQGSGNILLDNVHCTGSERSILDCPHNGINIHNCGHSEDASVTCELFVLYTN